MTTIIKFSALAAVLVTAAACAPQNPTQHEVACVGGTLTGAAIGGAIGNRFGGGTGQTIATAAGAFAGGATAVRAMNC
ncbi:glycine zipper 2TM domain-containing protein [Primorskyibacter sp. S87]|uniref:glycine zipper 2TM domain-containing protein n=1 Tax=Primorskyibacter sp. S87 TaxID=3415126 RepID=UPI003C7A0F4A